MFWFSINEIMNQKFRILYAVFALWCQAKSIVLFWRVAREADRRDRPMYLVSLENEKTNLYFLISTQISSFFSTSTLPGNDHSELAEANARTLIVKKWVQWELKATGSYP